MLQIASLGFIKRVKHKFTEKIKSIKIIKRELIEIGEDETKIFKEMALFKTNDHPNIIKIYDFYKDEKYFYLISE